MAADIVEIFEAFRESKVTLPLSPFKDDIKVMLRPHLTYAVLAVWNWSLLQVELNSELKKKLFVNLDFLAIQV